MEGVNKDLFRSVILRLQEMADEGYGYYTAFSFIQESGINPDDMDGYLTDIFGDPDREPVQEQRKLTKKLTIFD